MNPPAERFRACVFDAYGTLLDLASAIEPHERELGSAAPHFLALWRVKQLEYTWLRTLMGQYADFAQVTAEALEYACAAFNIADGRLRTALLTAFEQLSAYPDAAEALTQLRAEGVGTAVLSNGTPGMLDAAFTRSGLAQLLDSVLSVDAIAKYKPAPAVYALATRQLGADPDELLFVSANAWDVAGAAAAGLVTVWINRAKAPAERLPGRAAHVVHSLREVPALIRGRSFPHSE